MKKLLLTALAATSLGLSVTNAAVKRGDVAPDFTLPDINNVSQHLYQYLDQGYTVIIDVSAAWCGPCWNAHQSGIFNTLISKYGPSGSVTPGKIMVLFIEGESTNTTAQLHGTSTGSSYATFSQGDWVTGENYPIIDNSTQNVNYLDGGFPTFTVIGRDRIVIDVNAGYGSSMDEAFWMNLVNQGPTTGPSASGVDAKPLFYSGSDFFLCNTNGLTTKFQNYSQSQTITSANVLLKSGSTTVSTTPWSGSLAPMAVSAPVSIPAFTPAAGQNGPFTIEVVVASDANPANNTTAAFSSVIGPLNSSALAYSENLDGATAFPAKIKPDAKNFFVFYDGITNPIVGANGQPTKAIYLSYFFAQAGLTSELFMGNYNVTGANAAFEFDIAQAQFAASGAGSNDKLEILTSTDCGATWSTVWMKAGVNLKTVPPVTDPNNPYVPVAQSDWRHETVSLNATGNNVFVKMKATSDYGNLGWIDNFKVSSALAVNDVVSESTIKLYPNPATDVATLQFDVVKSTNVSVQVLDIAGRVIANVSNGNMTAGSHNVVINTANIPSGIYNVKIQTEAGSRTERLTVIK